MSAGEDVVAHPTICREAISFYIVLVGKNCGMDGLNLDGEGGDLKICLFMTSLIQSVGIKDISEDTSVTWNLLAS